MNVFSHILKYGNDDDFVPHSEAPEGTRSLPGSKERLQEYQDRLTSGESLYSEDDQNDFAGCRGLPDGMYVHSEGEPGLHGRQVDISAFSNKDDLPRVI